MRSARTNWVGLFLLAALAVSLPGVAEVVETNTPDGDCSEPCPGDTSDGNCPPSCDECTCCPRAMSALLTTLVVPGTPQRVEIGNSLIAERPSLPFVRDVFHPPRG